jgi:hypothetical protein
MFLSAQQAGSISKRLGHLLQTGAISHREYALGQTLLWRCRGAGQGVARVSYTLLGRLAHVSRKVVAAGLRKLQELGIIQVIKCRVVVGWASRQGVSCYRLLPLSTEFPPAPVLTREVKIEAQEGKEARAATEALARVRQRMEARMLGRIGRPGV